MTSGIPVRSPAKVSDVDIEAIPTESTAIVTLPDGRMNRKNAARYLGISAKTLAMHASRGTGPPFTKRGLVFYYREDLDRWMRTGRVASSAEARLGRGWQNVPIQEQTVESVVGAAAPRQSAQPLVLGVGERKATSPTRPRDR